MQRGENKLWLLGARVWAEYRIGRQPELYDFVAYDAAGIFYFRHRKNRILLGKTLYQLTNYPGFRPFLINLKYFDPSRLVVSEPAVDLDKPSGDSNPPKGAA